MRTAPLLLLTLMACPRGPSDGNYVTGELGGEIFDPDTVVFDSYGRGPQDTADPEQQLMLVLADAPDACSLLEPLFHYWWLRCESTCAGLYAIQDQWPTGELRVLWMGITPEDEVEAAYSLAASDGPGMFTATYRPVDLSVLSDMDEATCFDTCSEDYGFLLTDQGRASIGDLEVTGWNSARLDGSLDLLFSQGDVQADFEAPSCAMGLHGP